MKFGKCTDMWKLKNTFLNDEWATEEITREIRKHFEMDENKDAT